MMPIRNRAAARVRAPAPRPVEILLSANARRRFADFIMLLDTAERRSGVIRNERKKVKQSKIRDGPLSRGLLYFFKKENYVEYLVKHKMTPFYVATYVKATIEQQDFFKMLPHLV